MSSDDARGLTDEDVRGLAWLMNRLRPSLHRAGSLTHIAMVRDRPFVDVAQAVVAFAVTRTDQLTPATFPLDGRHWHISTPTTPKATPTPPRGPVPTCSVCGLTWGYHEGQGHTYEEPGGFTAATPDTPAKARAQLAAYREGPADEQA